jgi:hypothetical protein
MGADDGGDDIEACTSSVTGVQAQAGVGAWATPMPPASHASPATGRWRRSRPEILAPPADPRHVGDVHTRAGGHWSAPHAWSAASKS